MKTIALLIACAALAYVCMFASTYVLFKRVCPNDYEMNWMGGQCTFTISRTTSQKIEFTAPQEEGLYDMYIKCNIDGCATEFLKSDPINHTEQCAVYGGTITGVAEDGRPICTY